MDRGRQRGGGRRRAETLGQPAEAREPWHTSETWKFCLVPYPHNDARNGGSRVARARDCRASHNGFFWLPLLGDSAGASCPRQVALLTVPFQTATLASYTLSALSLFPRLPRRLPVPPESYRKPARRPRPHRPPTVESTDTHTQTAERRPVTSTDRGTYRMPALTVHSPLCSPPRATHTLCSLAARASCPPPRRSSEDPGNALGL